MSTGIVSEFAGVVVATNNLKICTLASLEACANAAAFIQEMLVAGVTEVSGTESPTRMAPWIQSLLEARTKCYSIPSQSTDYSR